MKQATIPLLSLLAACGVLTLSGCDDSVTAEQASEAAKILKQWQDQNK